MTQPKQMTEVEYTELRARAAEVAAPLGAFYTPDTGRIGTVFNQSLSQLPEKPPVNPKAPCKFAFIEEPMAVLAANANDVFKALTYGTQQWQHLAESLRNAAMEYQKSDENSAEAITTGGENAAEAVTTGGEQASTPPSDSAAPRRRLGSSAKDREVYNDLSVDANKGGLEGVKGACELLRAYGDPTNQTKGDQETQPLRDFADAWLSYRTLLREAKDRFRPFQSWSGPAHDTAAKNMSDQSNWCDTMAANCLKLAQQAETIIKAHKVAVQNHPTNGAQGGNAHAHDWLATDQGNETDLETLNMRYLFWRCNPTTSGCGSYGWTTRGDKHGTCKYKYEVCQYTWNTFQLNGYRNFESRFKKLQELSDAAQIAYREAVFHAVSPLTSPMPPTAKDLIPPKPDAKPDDNDKKPDEHDKKPDDNDKKNEPVIPIVKPVNPVKPTPRTPSMPQMPMMPQMPTMPSEPDAEAVDAGRAAAAGAGVKPASFGGAGGGGGPSVPLAPA